MVGLGDWYKTFLLEMTERLLVVNYGFSSKLREGKLPINLKRKIPTSLEFRERVKDILNSVRNKGYIQVGGLVNSFTNFFQ